MALGIIGGISAGLSIYQGVSQIFGGKSQQNTGAQQQALAQQQAQENFLLGEEFNAAQAESARLMSEAMQGQAAAMYYAAQQAAEAAEKNAQGIEKHGRETVHQRKQEHQQTEGMAKARAAASGIDITSGSSANFRKELGKENQRERQNIHEAFQSQAEVARQQGEVEVAQLHAAAGGALAGAQSVLADQQNLALLNTAQNQQAISAAGLVGQDQKAAGSSNIFSGIGNVAKGLGGLAGGLGGGGSQWGNNQGGGSGGGFLGKFF